ncbi:phosphoenolpyruvate phosphomutase [endosymbiont of Acanthamoeba sp. UWC8]|nr:phosphoenolpyruvate phosphomutase [endosymbiont of Acanthamoeba sp. UWC8]
MKNALGKRIMYANLDRIQYFWGAYDGVTAYLTQEAGKDGIWLSSLCHLKTLGLPDAEIAGIEALSNMLRSMRCETTIPIWVDGDTGFNGGVALKSAVKTLIYSGANGLCIEDKQTPKRNSFSSSNQYLEDIDKFCEKL